MKKSLMAISTIIILSVLLSGCVKNQPKLINGVDKNLQAIHNKYFDCIVLEDLGGGNLIVADRNTNVLYLFVKGYQASAMTPIYDVDGTPKLYGKGVK